MSDKDAINPKEEPCATADTARDAHTSGGKDATSLRRFFAFLHRRFQQGRAEREAARIADYDNDPDDMIRSGYGW
jgi:hypothetical protein